MSGVWLDTNGNKWVIEQTLNDIQIKIIKNSKVIKGKAKLTENILKFRDYTGIWNYNDIVVFLGGGGMERVNMK